MCPTSDFQWQAFPDRALIVDLSHAIREDLPLWPGDRQTFTAHTETTLEHDGYFTRSFSMPEHYGTHLDAPAHFAPDAAAIDEIPARRLFGPAVVVDVREDVAHGSDYALPAARVELWEADHGQVPSGAVVLLRTGWACRCFDAARYLNQDSSGTMHFPGFGVEAVRQLIERGASGIGIDTMSVDPGCSRDLPVHRLALGTGLYQLENLADLSGLPEAGAWLVVAPIKLAGGSGGPCRVFAVLPDGGL
jgi:kynurenine formamidase